MKPQFLGLLFLCFLQALIVPNMAFARPKVALLVSLNPDENRPPLRFKSWDINEKLEKKFRKSLKKLDLDLVVKTYATQDTLYALFQDQEVKAIFWVGHAGFAEGAIGTNTSIIDHKKRNLESVFQLIPPHLKYLALVGCRGQKFIDLWKTKGWPELNNSLKTFSREKRTDARVGLKKALKDFKETLEDSNYLSTPTKLTCTKEKFYKVRLQRKSTTGFPLAPLLLFQKDKLISVLPETNQTHTETEIYLSPKTKKSDLKIVLDTGYTSSLPKNYEIGELHFETEGLWKLFAKRDGTAIGVGTHIYNFKGKINDIENQLDIEYRNVCKGD